MDDEKKQGELPLDIKPKGKGRFTPPAEEPAKEEPAEEPAKQEPAKKPRNPPRGGK